MEEAWWNGYEAGLSGEGSNPYPFGLKRAIWEMGQTWGCQVLANMLEVCMKMEGEATPSPGASDFGYDILSHTPFLPASPKPAV